MKYKKMMIVICISICILFTTSCVFANEMTNETNIFDAQVLQLDSNDTDLAASDSLPASTVYFDASASSDGDGSKSSPYKVYKSDRINYGDTVYFADGVYDINEANSIHSSSQSKTTFIGQSIDKTILRSSLTNKFEFTVTDNSYLVLKDLTMMGVHIKNQANLIADNVKFSDSVGFNPNNPPSLSYSYISKIYDASYGGVIICDTPFNKKSTLNFTNCYFENNVASSGGVIATYNTIANIQNCVFYNSTAERFGGAIYSINSTLNIAKSSFDVSYAKYGGVIYSNSTDLNIKDSQLSQAHSDSFGGIIASFSSNLDINNVDFSSYSSFTDAGGAIYTTGGTMKVADSSFVDGFSLFGGAICNLKTGSTISNSEFINNRAKNYGGSIYNMYGTVALTSNTFSSCNASIGGCIFNRLSDSFTLSNNRFTNSLDNNGQIIFIDGDNVDVTQKDNIYDSSLVFLKFGNVYNIDYYASVPVIKFTPESIDVVPTFYDSRKYGFITPAKDQIQGGNCWAFSGIATLEACIGKATGIAYDFSEENVKNIMSEYSLFDLDTGVNNGGNLYMFIAYLAGWFGPTYDENDVYDDYSAISKLYDSLVHVQNVYILPERANYYDNNEIKKAVLKYGAVSIGIDLSQSQGHAVTIVGWDDEFTSSDFLGNKALGAWIIKNSWGTDWGYNGFGYLSYQQPISFGYTFVFDDDRDYTNIYQYDYEGKSGYHTINGNVAYLKNKFTAKNNEVLSAFSTYFDAPSNFTVSVYQNGKLVTTQSEYSEMGYFTIPFDKEISLKKGDTFEISVKFSYDGNKAYIPICTAKEINKISFKEGISFYSSDGENWVDLYSYPSFSGVACIKAFTRLNEPADISISLDQSGSSSNPFSSIDVGSLVNIPFNLPETDGNGNPLNGLLTFNINGQYYYATVEKGKACLNITFDKEGVYNVTVQFNSTRVVSNPVSFKINVVKNALPNLVIQAKDVSKFYGSSEKFVATLTEEGKPKSDVNVQVSVNGEDYRVKSDANGQVILDLDLPVGVYYVTTKYSDEKIVSSKFAVLSTIVVADITRDYGDCEISASFLSTDGNALTNEEISFSVELYGVNSNFNNKYDAKTNVAGMATSKINLPVSKYLVSVENPVNGEKKQFILDIMPIDTSCSLSITQSGSVVTFNAIIDTDASLNEIPRFEQEDPYVNFLIGDSIYKVNARFMRISECDKLILYANLGLNNLAKGDYEISAIFSGDENFKVSSDTKTFSVSDNPYTLSSSDYFGYYGSAGTIATLKNNSNPVKGEVVYATIGNKTYTATTDDDGNAIFRPDLEVGDYMVLFKYKGQSLMKYIFVKSTIDMDDLSGQYMDSKVGATFTYYEYTDIKLLKNSNVKFIVNGTEYDAVTDENGYASVDVDLPVGTHTVTAVNLYNGERKQSKITIFKTTPTLSISEDKRGDAVFITASLKQASAIGNVVFTMGSNKYISIIEDGKALIVLNVLDEGDYEVYANYIGDPNFNNIISETLPFNYEHTDYALTAPKVLKYYGGSEKFEVTLTNFNKPVGGENVKVTIDDVEYSLKTNANGVASYDFNLNPGTYSVYCSYDDKTILSEIDIKSTVTVLSSTVDVSYSKLGAEFRDGSGNLLKNKEVTFKIGNTEYKKTTDAFGTATLDASLNRGNYTVAAINPVTGEIKNSTLIITKSVPSLTLSVVKQNGVNVLKAVLPKTATGEIDFVFDNGVMYELNLVDGQCILEGVDPGEYTVTATYSGDDAYSSVSKSIKFTVNKIASVLTAPDLTTTTYGVSKKIVVTLKDASGNPLTGRTVTLNLNNNLYTAPVASDGEAEFLIPTSLAPKTYTATVSFAGDSSILAKSKSINVKVNKATPKLTAAKKTFKVKDKTKKYIVTLKTNKNKVYKNQKITIKVNGKSYTAKTNSKGQATFKLTKLTKKGTFKATIKFSGNSKFKAVTKKNIKITVK